MCTLRVYLTDLEVHDEELSQCDHQAGREVMKMAAFPVGISRKII